MLVLGSGFGKFREGLESSVLGLGFGQDFLPGFLMVEQSRSSGLRFESFRHSTSPSLGVRVELFGI